MPRGYLHLLKFFHVPEAVHVHVVAGLLQEPEMAGRADLVEDDAGNSNVAVKGLEPVE